MLKELNRVWQDAQHRAGAWRRWQRKLPHNRVRRPRRRDEHGRPIGYGPAEPLAEPPLPVGFYRKVELPSGRIDLVLCDGSIADAYRLARQPKPTAEAVMPLPIAEEDIRRQYAAYC